MMDMVGGMVGKSRLQIRADVALKIRMKALERGLSLSDFLALLLAEHIKEKEVNIK